MGDVKRGNSGQDVRLEDVRQVVRWNITLGDDIRDVRLGMPGWEMSYGTLYRGRCQTKGCQAGGFHTGCYTEGDVRLRDARLGDFIREFIQRGMSD